jgi:hypothetical protein
VPPVPAPIRVTAPEYKGITVDTKKTAVSNLLTHVEGSSWNVLYYSQTNNDDNALNNQSVTLNPVFQGYKLIKNFELKVTSPLTSNQDETSGAVLTTGTSNVYPFVIPNIGDMFLADIGDGREAVFTVTGSSRKTLYQETCYEINYSMVDYSTTERRGDLNAKVVQTLVFVRDFLKHGQNPLVQKEEFTLLTELAGRYREIIEHYFKSFTSKEFKTIIVPGQNSPVYDHFLTKALMSFFTTLDSKEIRHIRTLNCDDDSVMSATTIWDVLKNKDANLVKHSVRHVGLVKSSTFERNPVLDGIYYSGIRELVYPKDSELSVDFSLVSTAKTLSTVQLVNVPSPITRLEDLLAITELNQQLGSGAIPIKAVTVDDYYVFSQAFYDKSETGQSRLEMAVWDYLEDKPLNGNHLKVFCETYHAWGGLERLYYVPILLILLKAYVRNY